MTNEQPKDPSTERRAAFGRKLDADPVLRASSEAVVRQLREEAREDLAAIERSSMLTAEDLGRVIGPCPIVPDEADVLPSLTPENQAFLRQRMAELCDAFHQALRDPDSPVSVAEREAEDSALDRVAAMLMRSEESERVEA